MFGSSKKPVTKRQLSSAVAASSLTGSVNTTTSTSSRETQKNLHEKTSPSVVSEESPVEESIDQASEVKSVRSNLTKGPSHISTTDHNIVESIQDTQSHVSQDATSIKESPLTQITKGKIVEDEDTISTRSSVMSSPQKSRTEAVSSPKKTRSITSATSDKSPSKIKPPINTNVGRKATTRLLNSKALASPDFFDESENTLPTKVNEVISKIQLEWPNLTENNFNPVPIALKYVDGLERESHLKDSASGPISTEYSKFCKSFNDIDDVMNIIFNDYHESFNDAVHTFSSVVEYVNGSQRLVNDMRTELTDSRDWLQFKRLNLLNLWKRNLQYEKLNDILNQIEDLTKVPEQIDEHLENFRYLNAVVLMLNTLEILESPEFLAISALDGIRQRLYAGKDVIHESLINELQSVIYVRSVESVRTESLSGTSYSFSARVVQQKKTNVDNNTKKSTSSLNAMLASKDDEFRKEIIKQLLSTLAMLDKLPNAMQLMRDRMPLESYFVVERVLSKISEKHSNYLATHGFKNGKKVDDEEGLDIIGKKSLTLDDHKILSEFFEELYSNFYNILINIHYMFEEIDLTYPHLKDSINFTEREVWASVQNELKAIINEYLTNVERSNENGEDLASSLTMLTMDSIMRDRRTSKDRLGNKHVFHIGQIGNRDLIQEYQQLNPFAGVSHKSISDNLTKNMKLSNSAYDEEMALLGSSGASVGVIDKYANYSTVGHELLVVPDPYNVLTIFDPTISFVTKAEDLINLKSRGLKVYLEEFLLNIFLPQMENRIMEFFKKFVISPDSFATEWVTDLCPRPLCKSTVALYVLLTAICKAIPYVPAHREEVTNIVINLLRTYYEKCSVKFQSLSGETLLVSKNGKNLGSFKNGNDEGNNNTTDILSLKLLSDDKFVDILSQYHMRINAGVGGASQENAFLKAILTETNKSLKSKRSSGISKNNNVESRTSVTNLMEFGDDSNLNDKEIQYELDIKGEEQLLRSQMVLDVRSAQTAAAIYNSLVWFHEKMEELRRRGSLSSSYGGNSIKYPLLGGISGQSSASSIENLINESSGSMPHLQGLLMLAAKDNKNGVNGLDALPVLELQNEESASFDAILYDYKELSSKLLYLLRVENRCHIIYYLDLVIREGKYDLEEEEEGLHPDTFIGMLNLELSNMEEEFSKHLDQTSVKFIYDGLSAFCVQVLYSNYHYLRDVTDIGVEKLRRNVQSLQQNLLNVIADYDQDSIIKSKEGFQHIISEYRKLPEQLAIKSPQ